MEEKEPLILHGRYHGSWWPGPDSRNNPLTIGSDTILWSWSADSIPQTSIMIGSSDRENMKPNSLLPIESWHKSFTGKFRTEIIRLWLNENIRLMISIHDVTMWGVVTSFMSADTRVPWPVQCMHTVLLTIQHGLDMPYLTGMGMWSTSLKIYKLLTQDRPCFPVVCGF